MGTSEINKKVTRFDQAARLEQLKSPEMVQKTKAVRHPGFKMGIWIFKVQSAAAADGVYNCYQQTVYGDFGTTPVEVLNAVENDTLADYTPALAIGDRIAAWRMKNDAGTAHWVGIPIVPPVRMARTTEPAGASQQITCNLIANDGQTEITSGLGSGIEVYFRICTGGNINSASPRFKDDEYLFAENISGKWWYVAAAQASENHICA